MNQQEKHTQLLVQIAEIREMLSHAATQDLVWHCRRIMMQHPREVAKSTGLKSPYRQTQYLLGLLLTTSEPETEAEPLSNSEWQRLYALLEAVAGSYVDAQLPPLEEIESAPEMFRRRYAVALPAFVQHFHTGFLAQPDQILDRARAYLAPFDDELSTVVGVSGTDAVRMAEWIAARVPEQFDEAVRRYGAWKALHDPFRRGEKSLEQTILEMKRLHGKGELPPPEDPLAIRLGDLAAAFSEGAATAFWSLFVSRRGSATFTYFDDPNPADLAPLVAVSNEIALCPTANPLYSAVLLRLSRVLMDGPRRNAFLRRRDAVLEEQAERALGVLFDGEAEFFRSAYESPDAHHEHDLLVFWQRHLLVVEAKASPPATPFRDPERAFVRVQRAFRGDGGIQKAFDQAARLMRGLAKGERVRLYDRKGRLLRTVLADTLDTVHAICVTADDFGVLAVDLSLLLEKDPDLPYPWAVNIHSLESFIQAIRRKGWGPTEFVRYLEQRKGLHGHISNRDELEIAGMFIRHGNLPAPTAHPDAYFLIDPAYSQIFDDVYMERVGGREPDLATRPGPVMTDLRTALLQDMQSPRESVAIGRGKLSGANRNHPCPCGSGKKWKNCCGRA